MTQIIEDRAGCKPVYTPEDKREFMLAVTRTALARVRLLAIELEEVGVSLRLNMCSPELAVTWLYEMGADQFINVNPWPNKIEAPSIVGDLE